VTFFNQLIGAILTATLAAGAAAAQAPSIQLNSHEHDATLAEYRQHLVSLSEIVDACTKARDTISCDPSLVGNDNRVLFGQDSDAKAERRQVNYDWLRLLLSKAQIREDVHVKVVEQTSDKNQKTSQVKASKQTDDDEDDSTTAEEPPAPTTTELLQNAKARLTHDIAQTGTIAASAATIADHAKEREAMKQILSGRDFRNLSIPSARESLLEKLREWLRRLLTSASQFAPHSAWVGRVIVGGFIFAVCVGLVWGLLQLERRWRIRLVPESVEPAVGAASARDWQLYLKDARNCAAQGAWREAIHFVYWAAISRLESRRLWPADRARTPREYLALVGPNDARRSSLSTLTRCFERVWYGGRAADEADYRRAEALANALIAGNANNGGEAQ
jgi:hypothetical protein